MKSKKMEINGKDFLIKKFTVEQVADLLPFLQKLEIPEQITEAALSAFTFRNLDSLAEIFSRTYGEEPQWYKNLDVFEMTRLVTAVCGANLDALKNFKGTLNAMSDLQKRILEVASGFGSASPSSSNADTAESSSTP